MDRRTVLRTVGGALGGAVVGEGWPTAGDGRSRARGDEHGEVSVPEGYESRWDVSLPDWDYLFPTPLLGDGVVLAVGDDVRAHDADDGALLWERERERFPVVHGERVYRYADGGALLAVDARSGEVAWERSVGDEDGPAQVRVDADGVVLLIGDELLAFDHDGQRQWDRSLGFGPENLAVNGGGVALAGSSGRIELVERATGERSWARDTGRSVPQLPALAGDGTVVLWFERGVEAFGPEGRPRLYESPPDGRRFHPRPAAGPGRAYVVDRPDGADAEGDDEDAALGVQAYSLADGERAWRRRAPVAQCLPVDDWLFGPVPAAGRIYVGADGCLGAIQPMTGDPVGRFDFPESLAGRPATAPGRVAVTTDDRLYVFDAPRCDPPSLRSGSAEYVFPVPSPEQLRLTARVGGTDCAQFATLEAVVDGEVATATPVRVEAGEAVSVQHGDPEARLERGHEDVTLRLRRADGVVDELTAGLDDYRDAPADFRIVCADLDRTAVDPGEEVTARVAVRNYGYAGDYVARLEADGRTVAEERGRVSAFLDDNIEGECDGTTLELAAALDEPGEYDLRFVLEPASSAGSGASVTLDRVRVGSRDSPDDGGATPSPAAYGVGGAAATAGTAAAYWWLRRD